MTAQLHERAHGIISARTDRQIVADWEALDAMPVTPEIVTVRGWYMDALEERGLLSSVGICECWAALDADGNCTDARYCTNKL